MHPSDARRLPVGTTFVGRGSESCAADGCDKAAYFQVWTGTDFTTACEEHERSVVHEIRSTTGGHSAEYLQTGFHRASR